MKDLNVPKDKGVTILALTITKECFFLKKRNLKP